MHRTAKALQAQSPTLNHVDRALAAEWICGRAKKLFAR